MPPDVFGLYRPRTDLLVLCYHGVSATWSSPLAVRPEELEAQLAYLTRQGYTGVTLSDGLANPRRGRQLVVTFDDAFASVRDLAAPILREAGVPGTVYAPTALVDGDGPMVWDGVEQWVGTPDEHELHGMGWDGLGELAEAGWEVGAHTRTHPHLPRLDDGALRDELAGSRADVEERLGRPCTSLAYPFGDVDERVVAAAGAAGFAYAGLLPGARDRLAAPRPLAWPRIGIYLGSVPHRFALETSPALRLVRRTPAIDALAALGRLRARGR